MVLVDTNVISEAMRPAPDPGVLSWLNEQPRSELFLSTISVAELQLGVQRLPRGKRRDALAAALRRNLANWFLDRILPFDWSAAHHYAPVVLAARRSGFDIGTADAQIAAIASSQNLNVASRDIQPFRAAGLDLINPWQHPPA